MLGFGQEEAQTSPGRASFPGRKRGIFVLVSVRIAENNSRVKTLALGQSSQQITNSRRIGFLVYPGCEILDVPILLR